MNKPLFTGVCTALVTPFLENKVNYPMLQRLLKRQMDAGIGACVICGTTGEASTLSDDEKLALFRTAKEFVKDDMIIIAGTGSNCTEHAVYLSKEAEKLGVDGLLLVSPYYNKANEDGLFAHYLAIAHAVNLPVILYNVPGRTGVDIPVSVYRRLSRIPNIAGVKEASTSVTKISQIQEQCGDTFSVWSGNDDMTVASIALGAKGVISVSSNVAPETVRMMTDSALNGDFNTAAALQCAMVKLNSALFSDVNPIPVKAAMKLIGFDCGSCRLPLTDLPKGKLEELKAVLK